jgi:hypothetical protein
MVDLMSLDPRKRGAEVSGNMVYSSSRPSDDALAERDARLLSDTRSAAEKWLNDPPKGRSALDQRHDPGRSGRTTTTTS